MPTCHRHHCRMAAYLLHGSLDAVPLRFRTSCCRSWTATTRCLGTPLLFSSTCCSSSPMLPDCALNICRSIPQSRSPSCSRQKLLAPRGQLRRPRLFLRPSRQLSPMACRRHRRMTSHPRNGSASMVLVATPRIMTARSRAHRETTAPASTALMDRTLKKPRHRNKPEVRLGCREQTLHRTPTTCSPLPASRDLTRDRYPTLSRGHTADLGLTTSRCQPTSRVPITAAILVPLGDPTSV